MSCTILWAQEAMDCTYQNKSVRHILKDLKKEYGLRTAYDSRAMQTLKVSVDLKNASPDQILDALLDGSSYGYQKLKTTYIIQKRVATSSAEEPSRYNFTFEGKLKDRESGESLPYANIALLGSRLQTTSTVDGRFTFLKTPSDTLILAISYLGYQPIRKRLSEFTSDKVTILLDKSNTHLPAIDIIGELPRMMRTFEEPGHMSIDPLNMRGITNFGRPDVFKAMQFTTGFNSNDGTNADLNIRGGADDENLILWDGFTIYHLDHLFGVFSTINPEVVKNIRVFKSSYGAEYGGRASGVLDVTGRSGDKNQESVSLSFDPIGIGLVAETPLVEDRMSLLLAMRRSTSDIWNNALYQDIFNTVYDESVTNQALGQDEEYEVLRNQIDPTFYFYDINAKLDFDIDEDQGISLSFFQGSDVYSNSVQNVYLDFTGPPSEDPGVLRDIFNDEAQWGTTGAGAVWRKRWSKRSSSRTSIGSSKYASEYFFSKEERDTFFNGSDFSFESDLQRNSITDVTFKHQHELKRRGGRETSVGYQFTHLGLTYSDFRSVQFDNAAFLSDSLASANIQSIYFNRTRPLGKKTKLRFGGRLSLNSYTSRIYVEPRASIIHRLNDDFTMSIAGGNYIQVVRRLAEQNVFLNQPDLWVLSDRENFSEIRSFHLTPSLKWKKKGWSIDLEPYFKFVQGSILNRQQIRILDPGLDDDADRFVEGNTRILGLDISLQKTVKRHSGWVGYSFVNSENLFDEINEGRAFPSPFNKSHDFKLVYTYSLNDWEFGSTLVSSSGYAFTPLLGTFFNSLTETYSPKYGDDLSARLPDYFRWDLKLSRKFHWAGIDLRLDAGIYNLTDKVNVKDRIYNGGPRPDPSDELIIRESDLLLLGISPNFSIQAIFK